MPYVIIEGILGVKLLPIYIYIWTRVRKEKRRIKEIREEKESEEKISKRAKR